MRAEIDKSGMGAARPTSAAGLDRRNLLDGRNKAVSVSWNSLDKSRILRRITEGFTQAHDRRIQAVVKIHESIVVPESLAQVLATDNVLGAIEKHRKDLEGLLLKLDADALLAKLTEAKVQLKQAEAENAVFGRTGGHRK